MTYNLRNGYTVKTRKVDTGTEFVTQNPEGETISSVVLGYYEARELVLTLVKGRA
jgi:hypothetical protein